MARIFFMIFNTLIFRNCDSKSRASCDNEKTEVSHEFAVPCRRRCGFFERRMFTHTLFMWCLYY